MAVKRTVIRFYTFDNSSLSRRALINLKKLASEPAFTAIYTLEVIDLLENPALAEENKFLATPVLTKKWLRPEQ